MSFANPSQLPWGLLGLVILALYATLRHRRHDVSTSLFWQRALLRRSAWSKWRRLASLSIQLAVLCLLVSALADPYWTARSSSAGSVVLILDNSCSMNATDVSPSRFAAAVADARRAVAALGRPEQAAVLSAGGRVGVICPPSRDRREIRAAIEAVSPTDAPASIDDAVHLARRILDGAKNGRIIVFSDGCFDEAADWIGGEGIELRVYGAGGDNLGITRFESRGGRSALKLHEVLVEVTNFSSQPAACRLALRLGDRELQTLPLELEAGVPIRKIVPLDLSAGGLLTARLEGDDGPLSDALQADNQARIVVPRRTPLKVVLVRQAADDPHGRMSNEMTVLEAALRSIPLVEMRVMESNEQASAGADVTVFHEQLPERLPEGPLLVIAPRSSCDFWDVEAAPAAGPVVEQVDTPPLARIALRDVIIEEAVRLKFSAPAKTLAANGADEPIVSLIDRPNGRILILHVRLDRSDLVHRAAFASLVADAVDWLRGGSQPFRRSLTTGDHFVVPPAEKPRTLERPDGALQPLAAGEGLTVPLDQSGVWKVLDKTAGDDNSATPGRVSRLIAGNVLSARESNLQVDPRIASASAKRFDWPASWPLWTLLVIAALMLSSIDWLLFHRRMVV